MEKRSSSIASTRWIEYDGYGILHYDNLATTTTVAAVNKGVGKGIKRKRPRAYEAQRQADVDVDAPDPDIERLMKKRKSAVYAAASGCGMLDGETGRGAEQDSKCFQKH